MTPEQRRLRAKITANKRWSQPTAREQQAAAARSAFFTRLERQVDPVGTLAPDLCAALVKAAAREHSARLNAAKARKRTERLASAPIGDIDVAKAVTAPNAMAS